MQDFVNGEAFRPFVEEPTGLEICGYHPRKFFKSAESQSPSKNWRAAAVWKNCAYQLISGIILASVANASSGRHRSLVLSDVFANKLW